MTPTEYKAAFIRELDRMDPTGLIGPFDRAWLIAKTMQEVPTWDGKGISYLASAHNNLFGINAEEGQPGVVLEGNRIDKAQGRATVTYRFYATWEDSIRDCLRMLQTSSHYLPGMLERLLRVESIWATNPDHADEVLVRFMAELESREPSERRRSRYRAVFSVFLGAHGKKKSEGGAQA
jgi:hypothetical protein